MATERGGEEAPTRRTPQQQPLKGRVKMTGKKLRKVRKAAVLGLFVRKLETRVREGDQASFYKHLKTMNLEGKRDRSSECIKDEDGILLRDVEIIIERGVRWFHTLLNTKSPMLDTNIAEGLDHRLENMPLGVSAHDAGADRRHPLMSKQKGCGTGRRFR